MTKQLEPVDRLLRLRQAIGPEGVLPISRASFYAGIQSGIYPKPIRLGKRISVWRLSDLLRVVERAARS
jgi:prophage regulatory protein